MHTSFLTLATQTQLARYQEATGCEWEMQRSTGLDEPRNPWETPSWCIESGFPIKIWLSDLNLPSHLPPHNPKNVPAEVITAGGYRAWTMMERTATCGDAESPSGIERWDEHKWDVTGDWSGCDEGATYRVHISVPFPDWHLAGEPEEAVTPDTPTFSIPQPITDPMPPLAEGCQRYYMRWDEGRWTSIGLPLYHEDTHFFDLQDLPAPIDANRIAFEKVWLACTIPHGNKAEAWKLWNAARETFNS